MGTFGQNRGGERANSGKSACGDGRRKINQQENQNNKKIITFAVDNSNKQKRYENDRARSKRKI